MEQNESAEIGMNKTGIATAPKLSKEMIESCKNVAASRDGSRSPEDLRLEYIEGGAKIGSVPPPARYPKSASIRRSFEACSRSALKRKRESSRQ